MTRTRFAFLAGAMVVVLASVPAYAKADLSGTWKLVADKSDFGPAPVPDKLEQKMAMDGADLKVTVTQSGQQGDYSADFTYNTEGKETTNEVRGNKMKCTAKWDGDALLVTSKIDWQGNDIVMNDRYTVSGDGKTLTLTRKLDTPQGPMEMKIVLAKQ